MKRRPTIADVAAHAGVSKGAVSFALNGRPGVGEQTRQRILASARELGWSPSTRARALSRSRAFAMGLVFHRQAELLGADPFFPLIIAGIETVLAEHGCALLLQVVDGERREADSYRVLAQAGQVDGVFLLDLRDADPRLGLVSELDLPAVVIGTPHEDCTHPHVGIDDRVGIRQVVSHLVELGHTRIAHVAGPSGYVHSLDRERAWRQTLTEAGLAPGPLVEADFTGPGGAAATRRLLATGDRPTAIVYANDLMAIAGGSVALEMGLSIPGDVSITGFDDVPLAAHVRPALTTVQQDVLGWGRVAAETLVDLVDGRRPSPPALPPPSLVIRSSTGPPPLH